MIRFYCSLLFGLLFSTNIVAETQVFRLSDFFAGESVVRLAGKSNNVSLSIPLSSVGKISSATLRLEVVSSQALIEKRSQMYVRFNNATIGQIAYDPNRTSIVSTINIPPQLWREGFNRLTLAVSQHYAQQCVDGSAPELWSEVNAYNSSLTVESAIDVDEFTVSDLSGFFSPGIGGQDNVHIFSTQNESHKTQETILPLVAQALALRNQYKPLSVTHSYLPEGYVLPEDSNMDDEFWNESRLTDYEQSAWYLGEKNAEQVHVLVGTKSALSPVLSQSLIDEIDGPLLKVQRLSAFNSADKTLVPASYRLIISGVNEQDVYDAAKALAVMDDELNPVTRVMVRSQTDMNTGVLQHTAALTPGDQYTFEDLGISGAQFVGEGSFKKGISLKLPADFYVPEHASVQFLLDFGYGAGVGPGSMMNVSVNGEIVHSLYLGDVNGESFRDYQLKIPARFFKGGTNYINFDSTLRAPLAGVPCDDVLGSHLLFQISDSSSIQFPKAGHVAVQPDIGLFSDTAYPLARYNSAPPSRIFIPSEAFLDSALTLIAKLAQVTRIPLLNLSITRDANTETGSLIILGTPDTLNSVEQDSFVAAIAKTKRWPYRMQNMLYNRVRDITNDKSYQQMRATGTTVQESDMGDVAVLIAQRHPNKKSTDTLFIMAAQSPQQLNERVTDLVSLSLWGQMAGDFFAWSDSESPLLVMQVNEKYEVGESANFWLTARLWLSNNPWYWLVTFMLLVFFVSLFIYILLKRRNKQAQESW